MKTCKDCFRFRQCLRTADVVLNFSGGDHICDEFKRWPRNDEIVEVKRGDSDKWTAALFYVNGTWPTFAQYGSEIFDVTDWRHRTK